MINNSPKFKDFVKIMSIIIYDFVILYYLYFDKLYIVKMVAPNNRSKTITLLEVINTILQPEIK